MELITKYFFPLLLAYGVPCLIWMLLHKWKPSLWPTTILVKPDHPKKELIIGVLASAAILGMGQVWRAGYLIPSNSDNRVISLVIWWLNNLLIFSPVFITLMLRKQSSNTLFLSRDGIVTKLVFGFLATLVGVEIYMLFNGGHAGTILMKGLEYDNLKQFLPVFLEGVALAFLFVRLKWVVGLKWAVAIPAILFAIAHLPRAFANDEAISSILIDSLLTASITAMIFTTTAKSRDIIWLGILHYFVDIAIGAFS